MTDTIEQTAPNTEGTLETVRFAELAIAPENVRAKDQSDTSEDIARLGESIFARGLLKNLVGYHEGGLVKITAGRRRWKALAWLASKDGGNRIDADFPVPVLTRNRENAIADSLAENTEHRSMTAAQEIAAYRTLAKEGRTESEIARTHGTPIQRVRMLLRLATVAPMILKAFEAGDMSLETLKAFAARDDHHRQRAVFREVQENPYAWNTHAIRRAVLRDTLDGDAPIARFVGADAYMAAGGALDVDLFTHDQDAAWLDPDLAERLAREKMETAAAELQEAEGWQWFRIELDPGFYIEAGAFARVYPETPPVSEADSARFEELEIILEDGADDPEAAAEWEALCAKYAEQYPTHAREIGGFILTLDRDGDLRIERGLIRLEDAPARIRRDEGGPKLRYENPNARKTPKAENARSGAQSAAEGDRPHYTGKHRDRLDVVRRAAFQTALAGNPAVAFDLAAFQLVRGVVRSFGFYDRSEPLKLTLTENFSGSPAYGHDEDEPFYDALAVLRDGLPLDWLGHNDETGSYADTDAQFAAFRALPKRDRDRLFAFAVASSADIALSDDPNGKRMVLTEVVGATVKADVRAVWTPDAAFFAQYRKDVLLEILAQLLDGNECDDYTRAAKQPKGALASEIGAMFTDEELRAALNPEVCKRVDAWRPLGTAFDGPETPQEPAEG